MKFEFKPSFDRSVKSFHGREKDEIKQVSLQAIDILSQDRVLHKGLGLGIEGRSPRCHPFVFYPSVNQ